MSRTSRAASCRSSIPPPARPSPRCMRPRRTRVELAVEAARAAQPAWARLKPVERGRVLRRAADILRARNAELARLETLNTRQGDPGNAGGRRGVRRRPRSNISAGRSPPLAVASPISAARSPITRREALGVCVGIGAWNYPIQVAGWKSASRRWPWATPWCSSRRKTRR